MIKSVLDKIKKRFSGSGSSPETAQQQRTGFAPGYDYSGPYTNAATKTSGGRFTSDDSVRMAKQGYLRLKRFGKVGFALVAGVALSAASFWTTYEGLLSFTTSQPVKIDSVESMSASIGDHALAFLISFGIQATLFISAWIVARAWTTHAAAKARHRRLAEREYGHSDLPKQGWFLTSHLGICTMLAVCMGASIFFSFDSLFTRVFKPAERAKVQLSVARSETALVLGRLDEALQNQQAKFTRDLQNEPAWKSFSQNLDKVLDLADSSKKLIADNLREIRNAASVQIDTMKTKLDPKVRELAQLESELGVLRAGGPQTIQPKKSDPLLETKKRRLASLKRQIEELEKQSTDLAVKMEIEVKAGSVENGQRVKAGKGPRYRKAKRERDEVEARKSIISREATKLEGEIKDAENSVIDTAKKRQVRISEIENRLPTLRSEVGLLKSQLADEIAKLEKLGGGDKQATAVDVQIVARIRDQKTRFLASGSTKAFNAIGADCAQIFDILSAQETLRPQLAGLSCDTSGIAGYVQRLNTAEAARLAFKETCTVDAAFNQLATVQAYVDQGRKCINATRLPVGLLVDSSLKMDQVERENSAQTSHFTRTLASFRQNNLLTWVALAIAVVIDFIVFISAMMGAKAYSSPIVRDGHISSKEEHDEGRDSAHLDLHIYDDDPKEMRLRKVLLRRVSIYHEDVPDEDRRRIVYVADLRGIADSGVRHSVRSMLLNWNSWVIEPTNEPDVFRIDASLYIEVSAEVARYEKERAFTHGQREPEGEAKRDWNADTDAGATGPGAGPKNASDKPDAANENTRGRNNDDSPDYPGEAERWYRGNQ